MGDNNGLLSATINSGQNETIESEDYYFSFALGDEIALCHKLDYFILNCNDKLWKEVKKFMGTDKTKYPSYVEAMKWWKIKKKYWKLSNWSNNF